MLHVCDRVLGHSDLRGLFARVLICGCVKGEEEEQVGGEDAAAGERGEGFARARAEIRQLGQVRAGQVIIRRKIDKPQINHKLRDLQARDPFLPGHAHAACGLEIVPVHDDVNTEI